MFRSIVTIASVVLLVCVVVGRPSAPFSAQANSWQQYKAEGFSVLLPEPPTRLEIARPGNSPDRPRTALLFSAYQDRVIYLILAIDNPKQRDPLSRFIGEIEEYYVSGKAEKLEQELSGAGFKGQEYSFRNGQTLNGIVRFYLAADRAYIVEAIGDDITGSSVKQFFDSFALGRDDQVTNTSIEGVETLAAVGDGVDTVAGVFAGKDVTTKARVLVKPKPMYTEAARQTQTTGTVVLRGILTSTGHVTGVRLVSGLPDGLNEQAIKAARNIRFIPATKDGQPVSQHIQLEYNFHLF